MPLLLRFGWVAPVRWVSIMGALLLAIGLGGCSAVRLGYNSAPSLGYWWLNSYFDFDSAQSTGVKADLQAALQWHRKEELPLLAQQLQKLRAMALLPITPGQVCAQYGELQTRVEVTLDRIVPTIAAIAPTLASAQLEHISREFDKRNHTWREEWLEGTPTQRVERRVQQIVDRAESFYGNLTAAQLALVQSHFTASDFDANTLYQEKLRRHRDALQTLSALRTQGATAAQGQTELHALLLRSLSPPDPAMREKWNQWSLQICTAVAALHNSSSPAQRKRVAETLQSYENDIAALMAQR